MPTELSVKFVLASLTLMDDPASMLETSAMLLSTQPGCKQRIKDVDQILSIGDDIPGGKVFTPDELKAGVNGIKLDDDQIEYYYNMRGIMSILGILRNMNIRADMLQRGGK